MTKRCGLPQFLLIGDDEDVDQIVDGVAKVAKNLDALSKCRS